MSRRSTSSHGALLNVAEAARECQIKRNTAQGYVSVLEDLSARMNTD